MILEKRFSIFFLQQKFILNIIFHIFKSIHMTCDLHVSPYCYIDTSTYMLKKLVFLVIDQVYITSYNFQYLFFLLLSSLWSFIVLFSHFLLLFLFFFLEICDYVTLMGLTLYMRTMLEFRAQTRGQGRVSWGGSGRTRVADNTLNFHEGKNGQLTWESCLRTIDIETEHSSMSCGVLFLW